MKQAGLESALSMALYLQGGPGFGAPTPICGLGFGSAGSTWAGQALSAANSKRGLGRQ